MIQLYSSQKLWTSDAHRYLCTRKLCILHTYNFLNSTRFDTVISTREHICWFRTCRDNTPVVSWAHDDVIKWKHFPRYRPFVRGIHRSPVNSSHKGQWRGAVMFTLICARINGWVNNREAGDLRRHRGHYDVSVMNRNHFTRLDYSSP